ncbi:hypothetical protein N7541_000093 [Penicillium brevicompactum]|uniref:Uncharacterized protein n=1 Tax=Penicillium brevicompactum TaxID=5074 RepID=A0A9W9RTV7_PENBR|nr:hypothetical protein N7541_000093 [Penicillium brevicompactum]
MPNVLLPASAAAFSPRKPPIVVLDTKIPWLMATLKRSSRPRLCLSSVPRQKNLLMEILSPENAVWMLCSVILPNTTGMGPQKDDSVQAEGTLSVPPIHVKAYVVYVDLVWQNEVAFKLTPETIDALVERQSAQTAAYILAWRGSQAQLDVRQNKFVQAINKFTYRTNAMNLEGLEMDGTGELLHEPSEAAKEQLLRLYMASMPSPSMVPMLSSALPLPDVATPMASNPLYSSDFVKSWSNQSAILASSTSSFSNPTLGDTLDVGPTRYFSMDFASSPMFIPVRYPGSASCMSSHLPVNHQ